MKMWNQMPERWFGKINIDFDSFCNNHGQDFFLFFVVTVRGVSKNKDCRPRRAANCCRVHSFYEWFRGIITTCCFEIINIVNKLFCIRMTNNTRLKKFFKLNLSQTKIRLLEQSDVFANINLKTCLNKWIIVWYQKVFEGFVRSVLGGADDF